MERIRELSFMGGTHTATAWPGDKVTSKTILKGKTWFYKDYTLTKADDYVNFVFSIGAQQMPVIIKV